ncbi:MAG: DUF5752 family protein [Acidobacteriota bacterium]
MHSKVGPLAVKDCAVVGIATGRRAQNLREFKEILAVIDPGCLYHHFWGGLLRPQFEDPEYNNDFAAWARHSLHDAPLAERLAVIDPTDFDDLEGLRHEVIGVVEERLYESLVVPGCRLDQQLQFVRSQIVVFDTHRKIARPENLPEAISHFSLGSIFYHFIDARRRTDARVDDFRGWLGGFGDKYGKLCQQLGTIDPYFVTLNELRNQLLRLFSSYFGKDGQGGNA